MPYHTAKAITTAHWPNLEQPATFNAILEEWLDSLDVKLLEIEVAEWKKQMEVLQQNLLRVKKEKERAKRGEL